MKQLAAIMAIAIIAGCAGTGTSTITAKNVRVFHIRDAVICNTTEVPFNMFEKLGLAATDTNVDVTVPVSGMPVPIGLSGNAPVVLSSGLKLQDVDEVIIDRIIGWNNGVKKEGVSDFLEALGGARSEPYEEEVEEATETIDISEKGNWNE